MGNKTVKRLQRVDKQLHKQLLKAFGRLDYDFLGDMHKGRLIIVVVAKEK